MWVSTFYNGQWMDYTCNGLINAFCQFYPKGKPEEPKPILPSQGGCKEGWWPFAGYCYKIIGYTGNIWDSSDFKQYVAANTSCGTEWEGGMLAKLPTMEHNSLVAALLGPNFAGNFPWIGVYNWAYYDYYFSSVDQEALYFTNWETGKPNHLSGNTQRCTQMNWRYKQTYHDIIKLGWLK